MPRNALQNFIDGFDGPAFAALIFGILALVLFFVGCRALRRKRLLENVPTSKVKGVFAGLNEVKGEALAEWPLTSYLAQTRCVWYRYTVDEEWERTETVRDKDGKTHTETRSGWDTVASDEVAAPFSLRDDTGTLHVNPQGATMDGVRVFSESAGRWDALYFEKGPANELFHTTHRRRFTEHAIPVGSQLYVLGPARLRDDAAEVEIAHEKGAEAFMISMQDEAALTRRYGWGAMAAFILGALAAFAAPYALAWEHDFALNWKHAFLLQWPLMTAAACAFLGAIALYYGVLLYNGLVIVTNRMQRAWSLIDVQLKRRHDLIPALVACVKGYTEHEALVQEVASLGRRTARPRRAPSAAQVQDAAQETDAQTAVLGRVMGTVEAYPELKASEAYVKLHDALVDAEDRIALARGFFNDSVKIYNDRIGTWPDMLAATAFGYKSAAQYEIEAFEKRVPCATIGSES